MFPKKKGSNPKLDVPWERPSAVIAILSGVLCEILKNRRRETKIIRMDTLVPTRKPVDMEWVNHLSKKRKEVDSNQALEDIGKLYPEIEVRRDT